MKIQCPKCKSKYNIDITKIPEIPPQGIRTTCPKCKAQIPIKLADVPANTQSKEKQKDKTEVIIPCPKCGHVNIGAWKCTQCGVVFSDEEKSELSIHISFDE